MHVRDARDPGRRHPEDGDEATEEDGLAAVPGEEPFASREVPLGVATRQPVSLEQRTPALPGRPVAEVVADDRGEHSHHDHPHDRERALRGEDGAGDQRRLAGHRQAERLEREQDEQQKQRPLAVLLDEGQDRCQRHARIVPVSLGQPEAYSLGVRKPLQLAGLVACLVAGILLATAVAGSVQAAGTTTIETTAETTAEPTTVVTTETVEQTTTRQIILPSPTTTSSSSSSSETPAWVWCCSQSSPSGSVVGAIVLAAARRGGAASGGVSAANGADRLDGAVAGDAQGWALESQTADSAVLQRAAERMIVSVDAAGHLFTQPYSAGPPA